MPAVVTVKLVPVVAPCDHVTVPAHPLAVSVADEQTDRFEGGVIVGALGLALISRPANVLEVHPLTVQVALKLYVPTLERDKLEPEAPPDQDTKPSHPLEVRVSVVGEQTERPNGAVITGAKIDFTTTSFVDTLLVSQFLPPHEA